MKALVNKLKHFLRQCGGPTVVEYAVLLVLVIFCAMTAISLLGSALDTSVRSTARVMPSGQTDQGNNGKNDKKEKKQKRSKKSRKGGGRRRRSTSSLSAMSSSLARCVYTPAGPGKVRVG